MHALHRPPKHPELMNDNRLFVVCMISNPCRYKSRYRLYEKFAAYMETIPEVELYTVEVAFGDRGHEVTTDSPNHLQLRTRDELWHKENALNLGLRHLLPRDWKYACVVDCDIEFLNKDWAQEVLMQLQHHPVVQPFETAVDLGPRNNALQIHTSFAKMICTGEKRQTKPGDPYRFGHPGFCLAFTRRWFEQVGGLMDFPILGSADHHMLLSCIGQVEETIPINIHPNYRKLALEWQERCRKATQGNLGFVEGSLTHFWHGPKAKRFYRERWGILLQHNFDPLNDIHYDDQGLWALNNNKPGLKADLMRYFRSRSEDSMEE